MANKETQSKKTEEKTHETATRISPRRLYRSKKHAMIAGVAAGLGEYFAVDPAIIRLIFILITVFGGSGILVYIILWIILPEEEQGSIGSRETIHENVKDLKDRAEEFADGLRSNSTEMRTRTLVGYLLIGLGVVFVLQNFGLFKADVFWPLILIIGGLFVLRQS